MPACRPASVTAAPRPKISGKGAILWLPLGGTVGPPAVQPREVATGSANALTAEGGSLFGPSPSPMSM
jgi:hypothetical protein